ncbi:MAG TPA: hypothetical protein VFY39_15550 [Gammaproteobacteria bacterium]|nr:hypothetical protein [Gammaproteobacteria bacterium]
MNVTVRCGDTLAGLDNEPRRRAASEPCETVHRPLDTSVLLNLTKASLEGVEYVKARVYGQKPVTAEDIEHFVALDGFDAAVGTGNECGCSDSCVQQLVFAVIHIRGGNLGRTRI